MTFPTIGYDPTGAGLACGPCRADKDRNPRKPQKPATWTIKADGRTWRCCIYCAAREAAERKIPFPPINEKDK